MKIDLSQLDESHLGINTPDPLRFAFGKKTSPHAGGMAVPIQSERYEGLFKDLTAQTTSRSKKRCLYIHIPFCRVRCTFCNFFQNASSRRLIDDYFEALMKEIELKSKLEWTQSGLFHAVYIGGYGMMHHRTLDAYMDAMRTGQTTIAMMSEQSCHEPILASLKAGFDSGVVRRSMLVNFEGEDTFDLLTPLFEVWQRNGLVELHSDYLELTIAA
jgi:coproporphyrinogen III oxidase-like Fe-S oxidoreductase